MNNDLAVQITNIVHSYGDHKALGGVTFSVSRGEIFGLLGPNGGGKTTLFRILSTSFPATSGDAAIFGDDVRHGSLRDRIDAVWSDL